MDVKPVGKRGDEVEERRIEIYDLELGGMNVQSFAHVVVRMATCLVRDDDLIFEGFKERIGSHYSDVEFFEVVNQLERHIARRIHHVRQFILISSTLYEAVVVNYSSEKLVLVPLYGPRIMYAALERLEPTWGTYEVAIWPNP